MPKIVPVVLFLLASLALAASPAHFADYRDYSLSAGLITLEVADVNHDGIPDVLAGTGGGVAVLLGQKDGTLAPPVIAGGSPDFVFSLTVADFNNDGKLDLAMIVSAGNGDFLTLARGNGDGTFQPPTKLPIQCGCSALVAADFNGDGNMDLADVGLGSVIVYLGNGNGTFTGGQPSYPMRYAVAAATADLNGDGKPDLVVSDGIANGLVVLLGNGDGSFQRTDYHNGYAPAGLVLADFNGDGLPDIAVADSQSTLISVRLNQGTGVFGKPVTFATDCANCNLHSIAAGDFNHDGKLDLASPESVLLGNGDGTFQSPVTFFSNAAPDLVASRDLKADGFSDLVVGSSTSTDISVLMGSAHSVQQPPSQSVGSAPRDMVSADFNGDHIPNLAVALNGSNEVRILLGKSDGTFRNGGYFKYYQPGALAAADFNGDGRIDLAVTGEDATTIYLGDGNGRFTAGAQYAGFPGDCTDNGWPAHPCLATADFNGDGIPDLVGALWIQDALFFLLGNGDGTFRPGPTITLADSPQGVAVGDFNHDGKIDVAVSGYSGMVTIFPGKGDGTFGGPVTLTLPEGGLAGLAAGDIDGDGNLDIVVAGGGGGSLISLGIFVFTGNGNLSFNPPVTLVADQMPNWILLTDLNGDGKLDIVSADVMADNVAVLLNQGSLNFAPAILYGTGASPVVALSTGANSKAKAQLVTLNLDSGDITILQASK